MATIRAVYRNGHLQPLDPINLREGEEVQITILENDSMNVLENMPGITPPNRQPLDDDLDEDAALRELHEELANARPLSEIILEERYED